MQVQVCNYVFVWLHLDGGYRIWFGATLDQTIVIDASALDEVVLHNQRRADEALEACQNLLGLGSEGWVPT